MPIYEFHCNECGKDFEELVFSSSPEVACLNCNSKNIVKKFSVFAFKSEGKPLSSSSGCGGCSSANCSTCSTK